MAHDVVRASGRLSFLEAQMAPDFLQKAYTRIHEGMDAVKVKVLPTPGVLSTSIAPPWACTMCLTMERPRPVPWVLPWVAKGSKSF